MKTSGVHFLWQNHATAGFRTGVSLHSHTLLSRESLDFIQRTTKGVPWLSGAIRRQENRYRRLKGQELDLRRGWWTPPLSPRQAWDLEAGQIETKLQLQALVSLSDHDDIEAGMQLRVLSDGQDVPVSVEWTIPFGRTFFHIGVHNLPVENAAQVMREMKETTARPTPERIEALLDWVSAQPGTLVIFNHPAWDESHVGPHLHREHVEGFLAQYGRFLHAVELNGLRPWKENRVAAGIGAAAGLPLISGGDRHGREPNANLNLTNAATFSEFADEIRSGHSEMLFMPHYQESLKMRILEGMHDILQDDPGHAMGWTRWHDRVFYQTDNGDVKSLAQLWGGQFPSVVNQFLGLMNLVKSRRVRSALRMALSESTDFVL